jgi:hypothetical protein
MPLVNAYCHCANDIKYVLFTEVNSPSVGVTLRMNDQRSETTPCGGTESIATAAVASPCCKSNCTIRPPNE